MKIEKGEVLPTPKKIKSHSRRKPGEITLKMRLRDLLAREQSLSCKQAAEMLNTVDNHVRDVIRASRREGEGIFRIVEWGYQGNGFKLSAYWGLGSEPDADRSVLKPGKEKPMRYRKTKPVQRTGPATWASILGA